VVQTKEMILKFAIGNLSERRFGEIDGIEKIENVLNRHDIHVVDENDFKTHEMILKFVI
jgi:hypothetical protein